MRCVIAFAAALLLAGCATVSFESADPAILAGRWTAVGPEFQNYRFVVEIRHGQPRLEGEPQAVFKSPEDKKRYRQKYGYMERTVDSIAKAAQSLDEIARIGEPARTMTSEVTQTWNADRGELTWTRSTYIVIAGKRDAGPLYDDTYQITFRSGASGQMLFDNRQYGLQRPR